MTNTSKGAGVACRKTCQWYEVCTERCIGERCEDFVDAQEDIPLDNLLLREDKRGYLRDWWEYTREFDEANKYV